MAAKSDIEWTQATWNPIAGCSIVSAGCRECYAMRRVAPRLANNPATPHYAGTVEPSKAGYVWTGKIGIASDKVFLAPLRTRKPTTFFVNSVSDLFHEGVPDEVIDRIFAIMALSPQHTFQVLTKRPERMRQFLSDPRTIRRVYELVCDMVLVDRVQAILLVPELEDPGLKPVWPRVHLGNWPLPNVWLGTSAEDQKTADARIPHLLATPAAIRFLSAEPLLGEIDLENFCDGYKFIDALRGNWEHDCDPPNIERGKAKLDWVIVGGESGRNARPMHPDWARQIRNQCAAAGVPFFFKQWGNWREAHDGDRFDTSKGRMQSPPAFIVSPRDGTVHCFLPTDHDDRFRVMLDVGKKAAGRLLDGVEHDGMPEARR